MIVGFVGYVFGGGGVWQKALQGIWSLLVLVSCEVWLYISTNYGGGKDCRRMIMCFNMELK